MMPALDMINASAVRRAALDAHSARARGFERVSAEFLERINAKVRAMIEAEVRAHPSIGKTLK